MAGARGRRPDTTVAEREPPADPEAYAKEVCLRLLGFRPHTRAELAAALTRKEIDPAVTDVVLGRLTEVGLVDDQAFAEAWVSSRHAGRGLARRALAQELRQRGVEGETVTDAVDGLTPDTELATARRLVARRLAVTSSLPPDKRARRLASLLARKGYPAGVTWQVVKEALADEAELAGGWDDEPTDDDL